MEEEFNKRSYDRHIERLEERMSAMPVLETKLELMHARLDKIEENMAALIEAKYNIMLVVKAVGDMEQTVARHDARLNTLEKMGYGLMGMIALVEFVPTITKFVGAV